MSRVSNHTLTCLNVVGILIALSLIGFSLWSHVTSSGSSPCQRVLKKPLLVVGGALLVVSLVGLVGSCCRVLFGIYLFVLLLLILIFSFAAIHLFTIVVVNIDDADDDGQAMSPQGIGEKRLGEEPRMHQRYVINELIWEEIKSCWFGDKLCGDIQTDQPLDFYLHSLPPVQSGCCKPPNDCEFEFQNATYWTKPKYGGPEVAKPDCDKWSNVQTELCFDCESCKEAILFNVKSEWAMMAMIINACILIIVIMVNCLGCSAQGNNSREARVYKKQK